MQCNAIMYVRKSVRPYGMKSVSHFYFFYFFLVSTYGSPSVCTEHECQSDGRTSFSYFSCQYVYEIMDGQTSFSYFEFSFSSVAYSQVSVRPYGGPNQKKEKKICYEQRQKHRWSGNHSMAKKIKRDRWHNLMEISMYGRTSSVHCRTKKCYKQAQTTENTQKTLGVAIWRGEISSDLDLLLDN
jgi:hypothetical protein